LAVLLRVLRDREHDQPDERAFPVRHEYRADDAEVLAARDLGKIRAVEIAELQQLLAVARNDRREADMPSGRVRLHRAAPEQRERRQVRDTEVHEPDARAVLGRQRRANRILLDETAALDRGELLLRILELRAT